MTDEEKKKHSGAINRRELLKVMTIAPAAALTPLAPGLATQAMASTAPQGAEQGAHPYKPRVFNPHQWKTLHVLSDLIVPADERSGSATQAQVPEFIDDWLSLRGSLMKTEVLGSLTWMDMESNRVYGHDFVDSSPEQQKQLLDRIAYPAKAAPEDANAAAAFNHIRDMVLAGFFSSEMGVKDLQYLGNKMLEEWNGCPEPALARLGVSYSSGWEHWNKG